MDPSDSLNCTLSELKKNNVSSKIKFRVKANERRWLEYHHYHHRYRHHLFQLSAATVYMRETWGNSVTPVHRRDAGEKFQYKYYINIYINRWIYCKCFGFIFFVAQFSSVNRFAYFIGLLLLSTRTGSKMIL